MTCEARLEQLKAGVYLSASDLMWESPNFWTGPTLADYLAEEKIDKLGTQYRESPNLKELIRNYLRKVGDAYTIACGMLDYFDIDTAVGDQLTILGKVLGWPRCHCAGQRRPVFGLVCEGDDYCDLPDRPIGGLCEAEFDCGGPEYVEFCFTNDEVYRSFLKARIVTLTGDYSRAGLTDAARELFGPDAVIYQESEGVVAIATGRVLSNIEIGIAHLYEQVLPIAPGVRLEIYHSPGPPLGISTGWGGLCDGYFPKQIHID